MNAYSRRDFLVVLSALGLTPRSFAATRGESAGADAVFAHGVASGDPLHDRVILWTRVSPKDFGEKVQGTWQIATDEGMRQVVHRGRFTTDVVNDFTVKIDAKGLEPGRTYHYRFEARGAQSLIGRTRTLPVGDVARFRMAFASCANYPYGYFNAYARIAERTDIDVVLHLGDYIYEYPLGTYADAALAGVRDVVPEREIVTLADYRLRHAQYKSDPDLQEAHRLHPFICTWDDHELTNNAYRDGAENHNPDAGEGLWRQRCRQAVRAYHEYMPIRSRSRDSERIYRSFKLGALADLIMLDARLHGRSQQAELVEGASDLPVDDPLVRDPARSMLGFDQERWLARELSESKRRGTAWRVLGQQVMLAQLSLTAGRTLLNPDQWDGYAPARERLLTHLATGRIDNNIILTGDIHSTWCADVTANPWDSAKYDPASGRGVLGVEFTSPAITSPGSARDPEMSAQRSALHRSRSPHFKFVDTFYRGYGVLELTPNLARGEIYYVDRVDKSDRGQRLGAALVSESGNNALRSA